MWLRMAVGWMVPRGLATLGYGDGYAPHTSIMRILRMREDMDTKGYFAGRLTDNESAYLRFAAPQRGAEENDSHQ